ncbi:hypothetical protein SDC9_104781 [bioreactor metagenome]|uniref:Uncharacterized protein n=1 Tax=bioreactor metagenome TaxID=1076179 RepID=A0A645AXG7_9ZZZZ
MRWPKRAQAQGFAAQEREGPKALAASPAGEGWTGTAMQRVQPKSGPNGRRQSCARAWDVWAAAGAIGDPRKKGYLPHTHASWGCGAAGRKKKGIRAEHSAKCRNGFTQKCKRYPTGRSAVRNSELPARQVVKHRLIITIASLIVKNQLNRCLCGRYEGGRFA